MTCCVILIFCHIPPSHGNNLLQLNTNCVFNHLFYLKNEGGDQGSSNNAALLHSFLFWSLVVLMGPRPREIFSYLQSECLLNTECFE